jgi:cutinase
MLHTAWPVSRPRRCPNTREVLGGYSLGAVAADLVLAVTKPGFGFNNPCPGHGSTRRSGRDVRQRHRRVLGPVPDFSPAFAGKTIDQCASGDPICSNGTTWSAHLQPS